MHRALFSSIIILQALTGGLAFSPFLAAFVTVLAKEKVYLINIINVV